MMLRKKKNGLEWLEFELMQNFPEVKHGVFLHLDLGEKGDIKDQKRVLDLFGVSGVKLKQVHRDALIKVSAPPSKLLLYEGFDGMLTQEKEVGLLIRHADCQAAIFYDPVQQALANVHSGWRGSVQNIYQKTIQKMEQWFGSHPKNLHVCIGPSLGPDSAEFKHYRKEFPKHFWTYQIRPNYFDFWAISEKQLIRAGVPKAQIEIAGICTFKNTLECYSYRRQKNTPHHGTLAALTVR
jgi:polyphenol oxidase